MRQSIDGHDTSARRWIRTYPLTDRAFAEHVSGLANRDGIGEPGDLERVLRRRYPRAVVQPSELSGQPTPSWYVYREGHWQTSAESDIARGPAARTGLSARSQSSRVVPRPRP